MNPPQTFVKHIKSERIGRVVQILPIDLTDDEGNRYTADMYELAFDRQWSTECFWASEIEKDGVTVP